MEGLRLKQTNPLSPMAVLPVSSPAQRLIETGSCAAVSKLIAVSTLSADVLSGRLSGINRRIVIKGAG